jgi:hypothetical protein
MWVLRRRVLRLPYGQFALVSRDINDSARFPVEARRLRPTASGSVRTGEHEP